MSDLPPLPPGAARVHLEGWGRHGADAVELRGEDLAALAPLAAISRGLGRSYGDASLPPADHAVALRTTLADRLISFDPSTGELEAESGLSLWELNRLFLRRGWFTPVTPGTASVTLGGMVASDVHGKSHHCDGTFGAHVTALTLQVADGRVLRVSRQEHPELFAATIGGMGLTGHILTVRFRMRQIPSPWIRKHSERLPSLDRFLDRLLETAHEWPMTVGWVDCLAPGDQMGRGVLDCGRWATADEAPRRVPKLKPRITVPDLAPDWLVNKPLMRIFNWLYYWKHLPRTMDGVVHPETFFYPLDVIRMWNRMYGRTGGFTQYQCVLPADGAKAAAAGLLHLLRREGGACFLCVIKDCGPEGEGLLSFPLAGISLAIDLRVDHDTQRLVDRMNEYVIEKGGRIYLSKDSFTRPHHFRAMEPRLDRFLEIRRAWDPELKLRSALSTRLFGDPPRGVPVGPPG